MPGKKVPVTVSQETWDRLDVLLKAVESCISPMASHALDRSKVCHCAIRDLLDRYESDPVELANKLGFSTRASR